MKKWMTLLLCAVLCLGLVACNGGDASDSNQDADPLEGVAVTEAYDGLWSDGGGTLLFLDSLGRFYLLQTPDGRCGQGSYWPEESDPALVFDGVSYSILADGEGFSLKAAGAVAGTESLDGSAFSRDDWAELNGYSVSSFDGSWSNESGVKLTVSAALGSYEIADGISGTLSDDGNGKGPYLKSGDTKLYVVLSADKSSFKVLNGDAWGLPGTFLRALVIPGENDAETLASHSRYYDTWYQHGAKNRPSVILRADGTWESYNRYQVLTGKGTFFVAADGTLALYDAARKLMGTVSVDEKDRLYYNAEDADHEDQHPYLRSALSQ